MIELCPVFELYGKDDGKCRASSFIDEQTDGLLSALPGNNPITSGPESVTMQAEDNPPNILDEASVTGGRAEDHSVAVNRDGAVEMPTVEKEEDSTDPPEPSPVEEEEGTETQSTKTNADVPSPTKTKEQDTSRTVQTSAGSSKSTTVISSTPTSSGGGNSDGQSSGATPQNAELSNAELPLGLTAVQWAMVGGGVLLAIIVMLM